MNESEDAFGKNAGQDHIILVVRRIDLIPPGPGGRAEKAHRLERRVAGRVGLRLLRQCAEDAGLPFFDLGVVLQGDLDTLIERQHPFLGLCARMR